MILSNGREWMFIVAIKIEKPKKLHETITALVSGCQICSLILIGLWSLWPLNVNVNVNTNFHSALVASESGRCKSDAWIHSSSEPPVWSYASLRGVDAFYCYLRHHFSKVTMHPSLPASRWWDWQTTRCLSVHGDIVHWPVAMATAQLYSESLSRVDEAFRSNLLYITSVPPVRQQTQNSRQDGDSV